MIAVAFWTAQIAQEAPLPSDSLSDLVVTAPRDRRSRNSPTPVDYLKRFCFEPARQKYKFAPPEDDPAWQPLDADLRARFGATDPAVPAFRLDDPQRDLVLVVRFETRMRPGQPLEQRCIFGLIGKIDEQSLDSELSRLFRAGGTRRHVGDRNGIPAIRGWHQKIWTGMPSRKSKAWPGPSPRNSWIVVTERFYYDTYDHISADLKVRDDQRIALMSFTLVTDERPDPTLPADQRSSQ